jgi:hypothetical protein
VRVGEAVGDLAGDEQRDVGGDALTALLQDAQRPPEVAALDVLDGEEVLVADAPDLEDLGDVDVLQLDRDLRLVDEARDELLVLREMRKDLLDDAELLEAGQAVLG